MSVKNEVVIRLWVVFAGILLTMVAILFKLFTIGIIQNDRWKKENDALYVKAVKIDADRGDIISDDGSLLATSMPYYEIRVDMSRKTLDSADRKDRNIFRKNIDSLAYCLANYVQPHLSTQYYKEYLTRVRNEGNRHALLFEEVDHDTYLKLKDFPIFRRGKNAGGLITYRKSRRYRPFKELAFRTIGLNRKISDTIQSNIGLERTYDHILKGKEGEIKMQKIGQNVFIPVENLAAVKPESGKDIVTTLNVNMQDIAHDALLKGLQMHKAAFGTAIVMEVKTGAIKAIANLGREGDNYSENFNYAIGYATEPGSTFKLASMISMLEDGLITATDSVNLMQGRKTYFGSNIMEDAEKHYINWTTVQHAFEESSNVGISSLVQKNYGTGKNAKKFVDNLKKLHLWDKTGIDLVGEESPKMKEAFDTKNGWSALSLPWMSIGYEIRMTPLQILNFYNGIANDGKLMKPYLVTEFQSVGEVEAKFGPQIIDKNLVSQKTLKTVRSMLEGVVLRGTMKHQRTDKYNFAGKTGTSVFKYGGSGQNALAYQSTFVGYFPAEDPMYSCIVVINSPSNGSFYGSVVSGPVFREIADKIFATNTFLHKYMSDTLDNRKFAAETRTIKAAGKMEDLQIISKKLGLRLNNKKQSGKWASLHMNEGKAIIDKIQPEDQKMPNVVGMGLRDAIYALEEKGIMVQVMGTGGKVIRQNNHLIENTGQQKVDIFLNK